MFSLWLTATMKYIKLKNCIALAHLLFAVTNIAAAQGVTGIPIIENFSKKEYKAGTQNWSICQGSEGYMYFGNNQGVLQYTGYDWQLVEMSNYSIVRSLLAGGKDSILVGAFNDLGLLSHDKTGKPQYHSWNSKIPEEYRNYGEIWRIHKNNGYTIFQAFKAIIIFRNGEFVKSIAPTTEFRFSFLIDNVLYVQERSRGLLMLSTDTLAPVKGGDFFRDKEIWSLFKLSPTQLLIGTQYNGFYTYENGKISVWDTPANQFVLKHTLFNGLKLSNNQLAFGSVLNGLIITDLNGNIISTLNMQTGIQNNTVLSVFEDNLKNIWVGLDNGIDYIKANIPLSFVRKSGGFGTGYCAKIHNNLLYTGTNQGLFRQGNHNNSNDFTLVNGTEGQVWGLFSLNNKLLCGHNSGLLLIKDNGVERLFDTCGVWDVQPIPNHPYLFIMGTYYGFYILKEQNGKFKVTQKISGFDESARRFFFDHKGYLWMSHGYKGVYQLKLSTDATSINLIRIHNSTSDLPKDYNNEAVYIRHKVLATTEEGIYEYSYDKDIFIRDTKWDEFFNGDASQFTRMIEGNEKKIWAFKKGSIQLLTYLSDKVHEVNTRSFLLINGTLSRSYENVLELEPNRYLLGTEDGFVLFTDTDVTPNTEPIPMTIAWVESVSSNQHDLGERIPIKDTKTNNLGSIPYRKRHLNVNLSMPFYSSQDLVRFRYRINKGDWSIWLNGNSLDLNGLTNGSYKIDIQCSIDENEIAGETHLLFSISTPIQRTWYAYLTYLILLVGLSSLAYRFVRNRIEREKRLEYLEQKKKMIQQSIKLKRKTQEAENELNRLKNEKLEADIIYKSKELANTTMNIIQKNIILGEIREMLQELVNENTVLRSNRKVFQLLRMINKGIEHNDEWKVFEKNFDQVHENFLHKLKEQHPELTAKDMRLAAYLRMNLSSKEIAPLMNISVRSVEISRYRLRKKIALEHDQNLYDYLMTL